MAEPGDSDPSDHLDQLIDRFVEGGYAPEGAEMGDGEGGAHGGHGHAHGSEPTVREFEYRGHTVRIVTHYEVTIDGEPWTQRAKDSLFSIVWPTMTPNQLLDPGRSELDWYEYDLLPG
jgi:hypothetical protein